METQHCVQLRRYLLKIQSIIIFMASAGVCVHSSSLSLSKVVRCHFVFYHNNDPNISSQKYLMKSYFEKHDSLHDSDIEDFLPEELHFGSCKVLQYDLNSVLGVSALQRYLIGEGSHRRLFSSIKFDIKLEATMSELPKHFCKAVIIERLPPGVFADPFELQHLVQHGAFLDAAVFGDTNLELPSALSNRSVVEVHMDMGHNILSRRQKEVELKIELPLHARYPPLDESGYSGVEISIPDLFMKCSLEEEVKHDSFWISISPGAELKTNSVLWRIPSGNREYAKLVSIITFLSASLSTLLIVLASIYSSGANTIKQA